MKYNARTKSCSKCTTKLLMELQINNANKKVKEAQEVSRIAMPLTFAAIAIGIWEGEKEKSVPEDEIFNDIEDFFARANKVLDENEGKGIELIKRCNEITGIEIVAETDVEELENADQRGN